MTQPTVHDLFHPIYPYNNLSVCISICINARLCIIYIHNHLHTVYNIYISLFL